MKWISKAWASEPQTAQNSS